MLVTEFKGDINARSSAYGATPLLLLLKRGWALLALSAASALQPDASLATSWGLAPLHIACRQDTTGVLTQRLLACGGDPNAADGDGLSPLHHAAAAGHLQALVALIAAGGAFPDPTDETARGMRRAAQAARAKQLAAMRLESADQPQEPEDEPASDSDDEGDTFAGGPRPIPKDAAAAGFVDEQGSSGDGDGDRAPREWLHPIHCAVTEGRAETVDALISRHGVPLSLTQPTSDDTLLHSAAKCGHAAVLQVVLKNVAASPERSSLLESLNASGCTPLVDAIATRKFDSALALLEAGANARAAAPPLITSDFPDALAMAVSVAQLPLAEALLARGGDPNSVNSQGETTFHLACSMGLPRIARALLEHGADARADVATTGETALHLLAQRSEDGASQDAECGGADHDAPARREVAQLLLDAGLDVNARTVLAGHTPVWLAAFHGSLALATWLVQHGADPRIKDDGRNPALRPADAFEAPLMNEARRAYSPSERHFKDSCGAFVAKLRKAWESSRGLG